MTKFSKEYNIESFDKDELTEILIESVHDTVDKIMNDIDINKSTSQCTSLNTQQITTSSIEQSKKDIPSYIIWLYFILLIILLIYMVYMQTKISKECKIFNTKF